MRRMVSSKSPAEIKGMRDAGPGRRLARGGAKITPLERTNFVPYKCTGVGYIFWWVVV